MHRLPCILLDCSCIAHALLPQQQPQAPWLARADSTSGARGCWSSAAGMQPLAGAAPWSEGALLSQETVRHSPDDSGLHAGAMAGQGRLHLGSAHAVA